MTVFRGMLDIFRRVDWILMAVVTLLCGFGMVELYSLAASDQPPDFSRFTRQVIAIAIGVVGIMVLMILNYRWLSSIAPILYATAIVLLVLVLVIGVEIRGTVGWLSIGGFSIQPVEFVKVFLIVYFARFFSERSDHLHEWRTILWSIAILVLPTVLVLLQPDLGSGMMIVAIWLGMLAITKIRRVQLTAIVAALIAVGVLAFFFALNAEQQSRLLVFLDQDNPDYAFGIGYHVDQSITAIGSGEWNGRGLGLGPQSQLNFLPEQETDFIFAVIGEELGFLGAMTLVMLLVACLFRIARSAMNTRDDFAVFLCWGVFTFIFVQSFINIGMNLGIAPVTGLPLPFISGGGTSMIAVLACIGIVQSVFVRRNQLG
ncbi:MAG: rod shape-determining protein RodA [Candidatus Kerfeldbacteria bacterium]|nr:rod shape-determining protein RodA [Candidatus Kerfeldbacteria bacterium]